MRNIKKYAIHMAWYLGIGGLLFVFVWYISTKPSLPPISVQGHIEKVPPSHILDSPMSSAVQKHMLEHADGKGLPGIIIQYNCREYSCEKGMINKLRRMVKQYPDNVYLAPNNYDGKIILTRDGERKILTSFDKQAIIDFIEEN